MASVSLCKCVDGLGITWSIGSRVTQMGSFLNVFQTVLLKKPLTLEYNPAIIESQIISL